MSTLPPISPGEIPPPQLIDPEIAELLARRWSEGERETDEVRIQQWISEGTHRIETVAHLFRIWEESGRAFDDYTTPDIRQRVLNAIHYYGLTDISEQQQDLAHEPLQDDAGETNLIDRAPTSGMRVSRRLYHFKRSARYVMLAASLVIIAIVATRQIGPFSLLMNLFSSTVSIAHTSDYITQRGEYATIDLVDGTRVILGPESRLHYPDVGRSAVRTVTLKGIAHFTVSHDPARPFVVYANNAVVQELGTAFSVQAFPEDSVVRVTVFDGRIVLREHTSSHSSGTVLVQADAAELNSTGLVTVQRGVDVNEADAWTRKRLIFNGTRVDEVIKTLERWYDLKITARDHAILSQKMRGEFRQQPMDEVLGQLARTLGVRYEASGRSVLLY